MKRLRPWRRHWPQRRVRRLNEGFHILVALFFPAVLLAWCILQGKGWPQQCLGNCGKPRAVVVPAALSWGMYTNNIMIKEHLFLILPLDINYPAKLITLGKNITKQKQIQETFSWVSHDDTFADIWTFGFWVHVVRKYCKWSFKHKINCAYVLHHLNNMQIGKLSAGPTLQTMALQTRAGRWVKCLYSIHCKFLKEGPGEMPCSKPVTEIGNCAEW